MTWVLITDIFIHRSTLILQEFFRSFDHPIFCIIIPLKNNFLFIKKPVLLHTFFFLIFILILSLLSINHLLLSPQILSLSRPIHLYHASSSLKASHRKNPYRIHNNDNKKWNPIKIPSTRTYLSSIDNIHLL